MPGHTDKQSKLFSKSYIGVTNKENISKTDPNPNPNNKECNDIKYITNT